MIQYAKVSCKNEELKAQDTMQMLELIKDKNYRINACDLVSNSSGKLLQKAIKNTTIKWTCSGNGAKGKKGKICFSKAGEYTLYGYTKKKVFVIPLIVIDQTKF